MLLNFYYMTIQELKNTLTQVEQLVFRMEDGNKIPSHFHITEVGQIEKRFILFLELYGLTMRIHLTTAAIRTATANNLFFQIYKFLFKLIYTDSTCICS